MLPPLKKEESLQAVIIGDSYDKKFGPLTLDTPRCLLPVCNRPLLSYALASLKSCGVQDIILYCTSHADQVKKFVNESAADPSAITVITNEDCRSFGDAIRDLDAKGLLRQNFILMQGDTIANIDLAPILETHKQSIAQDRNASMTLVYRKAAPGHPCRTLEDEMFVAIDGKGNRILHHQRALAGKFNVPLEIFDDIDAVRLCFDLMDVGIAVCSPAIPPLFADNFDFQTMEDFLKGVMENDLVDNTIYMHEITEEYAARASNLLTYQAVTRDVLSRWSYPFVPDLMSLPQDQGQVYKYGRHNVYTGQGLVLGKGSSLKQNVIVGHGSKIGQNSVISDSALGQNCSIGQNVLIRNSILLDGVVVEDNCQILGSVVGQKSILRQGAVIEDKSVLGSEVEIDPDMVVPSRSRLTNAPGDDGFSDDDNDDEGTKFGSKAFKFVDELEDDDDDDDEVAAIARDVWGLSLADVHVSDEDSSSDESDIEGLEDAGDIMLDEDAKFSVFKAEVFESLQRGLKEGIKADNLILEINSSRHAYAVSANQVVHSVFSSILNVARQQEGDLTGPKLLKEIQKTTQAFVPILSKYVKDQSAQIEALLTLEQHCHDHSEFVPVAMKTIHFLYELDVLSEDSILSWFAQSDPLPGFSVGFRQKIQPFIDWLEESDYDDDDDDDSE